MATLVTNGVMVYLIDASIKSMEWSWKGRNESVLLFDKLWHLLLLSLLLAALLILLGLILVTVLFGDDAILHHRLSRAQCIVHTHAAAAEMVLRTAILRRVITAESSISTRSSL